MKERKIKKIWLGNRYYIEDTKPVTLIDSKTDMAISCGYVTGICPYCWNIILDEGIKALRRRQKEEGII